MPAPARHRSTSSTPVGCKVTVFGEPRAMRLLQYVDNKRVRVGRADANGAVTPLARFETMYELARKAIAERQSLEQVVSGEQFDAPVEYASLLRERRLLPPLTHPDPAHCLVSGTGL